MGIGVRSPGRSGPCCSCPGEAGGWLCCELGAVGGGEVFRCWTCCEVRPGDWGSDEVVHRGFWPCRGQEGRSPWSKEGWLGARRLALLVSLAAVATLPTWRVASNNTDLFLGRAGAAKSEIRFSGLQSRCRQGWLSGRLEGRTHPLYLFQELGPLALLGSETFLHLQSWQPQHPLLSSVCPSVLSL